MALASRSFIVMTVPPNLRETNFATMKYVFALTFLLMAIAPAAETQTTGADVYRPGRGIERAMTLLAESTPERRNSVRILFYGQSGMESPWWPMVVEELKRRFPSVNFVIENRALGGFPSQLLVKTSESDLYPFQPDLLIFNVSGADDAYEDIIRRTATRTVADVLILNDYLRNDAALSEESDPAKIVRGGPQWNQYWNYIFLPTVAQKYGAGLIPVRQLWKQHLTENKIPATDLLGADKSHLGEKGCKLMAEIVNRHLVAPQPGSLDPLQDNRVKTLRVGKDIEWKDGKLDLTFEGNRVDLVFGDRKAQEASILIDGTPPSQHKDLYSFTRATTSQGGKFPIILKIGSNALPLVEDWTLEAKRDPLKEKQYTFSVKGSRTGPDGEGRTDTPFVSRSARVVIEPQDWCYEHVFGMVTLSSSSTAVHATGGPAKQLPESFVVRWQTELLSKDAITVPETEDSGTKPTVMAVQNLRNGPHRMEIAGGPETQISEIRVYRPPLTSGN